jgi:hypothetical protein
MTIAKGKMKAAPNKGGGNQGPKWRSLEDECLAKAWKTVSIDPISGAKSKLRHVLGEGEGGV